MALARPLDGRFDLTSVEGKIVTRLFDQPERVYQEHVARFAVGPSAGLARGFAPCFVLNAAVGAGLDVRVTHD